MRGQPWRRSSLVPREERVDLPFIQVGAKGDILVVIDGRGSKAITKRDESKELAMAVFNAFWECDQDHSYR